MCVICTTVVGVAIVGGKYAHKKYMEHKAKNMKYVDLTEDNIKGSFLMGTELGQDLRHKYNLDVEDKAPETVCFIIPSTIHAVSDTWFMGMFGKSLLNLKIAGFKKKYQFDTESAIQRMIHDVIETSYAKLTVKRVPQFALDYTEFTD